METISWSEVKIRKARKCWGCATHFPVGSKLQRCVNVDAGEIYSVYFCDICQEWFTRTRDHDGVAFGELRDCETWKQIAEEQKPRPTTGEDGK